MFLTLWNIYVKLGEPQVFVKAYLSADASVSGGDHDIFYKSTTRQYFGCHLSSMRRILLHAIWDECKEFVHPERLTRGVVSLIGIVLDYYPIEDAADVSEYLKSLFSMALSKHATHKRKSKNIIPQPLSSYLYFIGYKLIACYSKCNKYDSDVLESALAPFDMERLLTCCENELTVSNDYSAWLLLMFAISHGHHSDVWSDIVGKLVLPSSELPETSDVGISDICSCCYTLPSYMWHMIGCLFEVLAAKLTHNELTVLLSHAVSLISSTTVLRFLQIVVHSLHPVSIDHLSSQLLEISQLDGVNADVKIKNVLALIDSIVMTPYSCNVQQIVLERTLYTIGALLTRGLLDVMSCWPLAMSIVKRILINDKGLCESVTSYLIDNTQEYQRVIDAMMNASTESGVDVVREIAYIMLVGYSVFSLKSCYKLMKLLLKQVFGRDASPCSDAVLSMMGHACFGLKLLQATRRSKKIIKLTKKSVSSSSSRLSKAIKAVVRDSEFVVESDDSADVRLMACLANARGEGDVMYAAMVKSMEIAEMSRDPLLWQRARRFVSMMISVYPSNVLERVLSVSTESSTAEYLLLMQCVCLVCESDNVTSWGSSDLSVSSIKIDLQPLFRKFILNAAPVLTLLDIQRAHYLGYALSVVIGTPRVLGHVADVVSCSFTISASVLCLASQTMSNDLIQDVISICSSLSRLYTNIIRSHAGHLTTLCSLIAKLCEMFAGDHDHLMARLIQSVHVLLKPSSSHTVHPDCVQSLVIALIKAYGNTMRPGVETRAAFGDLAASIDDFHLKLLYMSVSGPTGSILKGLRDEGMADKRKKDVTPM